MDGRTKFGLSVSGLVLGLTGGAWSLLVVAQDLPPPPPATDNVYAVFAPMLASDSGLTQPPTPFPDTPTPSGSTCQATASITALNKGDETVTVSGNGNLNGWYLVSERGSQRFDFPPNFSLTGSVTIYSDTPEFPNTPTSLWWSVAPLWNNSEDDDALLYDCTGALRSTLDDDQ